MTLPEQEHLQEILNEALRDGKPWVAFNNQPDRDLQPQMLHFFSAAGEAEKFCDDANGPDTFVDQVFNWDNYMYLQVSTLKTSLQLDYQQASEPAVDISAIARDMAAQSLYLPPGRHIDEMEAVLSQGAFYPVHWQRQIDPLREIADFQVIAHRHDGGMIYETGHSHRVMEVFDNYKDARAFMEHAVFYNELSDKVTDYLLVGRFHNKALELDMEGYSMPHAGLTLVAANHNYDHGHDYHELQSLFEPATLSQYFFAGIREGKLALFNENLEPTHTGLPQQPFYPAYYHQDYLTIKTINAMNQSSFEYTRDQLKFLGFGEDIAKDLHTKMDQNLAEFTLNHKREFGKDAVESVLYFSKGDDQAKDMTFFNRYDSTLKKEGMEDLTQTFFVGQKHNYTLQERYNMMDGRAVFREQPRMEKVKQGDGTEKMKPTGEIYWSWRALDFKEADRYGNFNPKIYNWDHEKELQKYPIKNIAEKYDRAAIMRPLQKGNVVEVTLVREGQETQAKVVANPKMLRLDFYDVDGQKMNVRQVQKQSQEQEQKTEMTPQQVRQAALDRAAEGNQQQNAPAQNQQNAQEAAKMKAGEEQQVNNSQRRRTGVRV